jgi:uroporphyrinogen-III decarboxylase
MGVTDNIKDTARKVTNKVVDTTERVIGSPKSPKELAGRMIEHLSHQEYKEVVHMLSEETKKYLDKIEVKNKDAIKEKLEDFEKIADSAATDLENNDYKAVITTLKKLEKSIPDDLTKTYKPFKGIKSILTNMIEAIKKHQEDEEELDFKDLGKTIESFLSEFKIK